MGRAILMAEVGTLKARIVELETKLGETGS